VVFFFKSFFNKMFIGFSFDFLIVLSILLGEIIYVIYKLFTVHCRYLITSFLFQECIAHTELLMNDETLRDKLIQSASEYVNLEHSLDTERRLYCDVVKSCLNNT
jgi:hypothetical protein